MWYYNGVVVEDLEDLDFVPVGMVYLITNSQNGKKYIGKKIFKNQIKRKTKKTKRSKIIKKDSNWKDYYGSSPSLTADVDKFGKESFRREILHLCKNKSAMAYLEAKEQFLREVLETAEYYNEHIMCRVRKANIKL